jgi:hypothetical protein
MLSMVSIGFTALAAVGHPIASLIGDPNFIECSKNRLDQYPPSRHPMRFNGPTTATRILIIETNNHSLNRKPISPNP